MLRSVDVAEREQGLVHGSSDGLISGPLNEPTLCSVRRHIPSIRWLYGRSYAQRRYYDRTTGLSRGNNAKKNGAGGP